MSRCFTVKLPPPSILCASIQEQKCNNRTGSSGDDITLPTAFVRTASSLPHLPVINFWLELASLPVASSYKQTWMVGERQTVYNIGELRNKGFAAPLLNSLLFGRWGDSVAITFKNSCGTRIALARRPLPIISYFSIVKEQRATSLHFPREGRNLNA